MDERKDKERCLEKKKNMKWRKEEWKVCKKNNQTKQDKDRDILRRIRKVIKTKKKKIKTEIIKYFNKCTRSRRAKKTIKKGKRKMTCIWKRKNKKK